jgi:hypothetical protein
MRRVRRSQTQPSAPKTTRVCTRLSSPIPVSLQAWRTVWSDLLDPSGNTLFVIGPVNRADQGQSLPMQNMQIGAS